MMGVGMEGDRGGRDRERKREGKRQREKEMKRVSKVSTSTTCPSILCVKGEEEPGWGCRRQR